MNTPQPGCFTKVEINNTVDSMRRTDNFWGYCPQDCNGELPVPSSPFNLAKSKYANLWSSFFFDLNDWENGLCHTYDPPEKSTRSKIYQVRQTEPQILDFQTKTMLKEKVSIS